MTGSFADTHVTLEVDGRGRPADPGSLAGKLSLHADGGDSATVLRQIGLSPLQVRSAPLSIDAKFDGSLASAGKLNVAGSVAGVDIDYQAETSLRDGSIALAGPLKVASKDIDPVLLLAGIGVPGVGEGHAASANGRLEYSNGAASLAIEQGSFAGQPVAGKLWARLSSDLELSGALDLEYASLPFLASLAVGTEPGLTGGRWSQTAFAAAVPPDLALDVTLNAESLDVGAAALATAAKLDFALSGDVLNVDLVDSVFAGGVLKGSLAATLQEGEADVSLRGGLVGADLQALVWEDGGLPVASGKLDLSLEGSGRGHSLAAILDTLGGSGSFSVENGRLNALNADALSAVMAAAEGDKEPDPEEARETFAQLFGSGTMKFGRAAGAFSVSDGVVTVPTVLLAEDATTILAGARLDLKALDFVSDWMVRSGGAEDKAAQPSVQVHFSGSIADPERRIGLEPLLSRLQSRFLEHQIEVLEARRAAELKRAEERRQAVADRRDLEWAPAPEPPAAIPMTPIPMPAPSLFSPNLLDPMPMSADPAAVQIDPDLPPLQPGAGAAPITGAPPPRRRLLPLLPGDPLQLAPIELAPSSPADALGSDYRMLPNGTIVKVR